MSTVPLLVGAYAALPSLPAEQEAFYAGLAEQVMADGLEIPSQHVRGLDAAERERFAAQLRGRFRTSVLTAIPGTMQRQAATPGEGLAAPDETLRRRAVEWIRGLREDALRLNDLTGEASISTLLVHSAPSHIASAASFARSLDELLEGSGAQELDLQIEHCDAASDAAHGDKRLLGLEDELALAVERGLRVSVNWGRSAVEAQDPDAPRDHIARLAASGALGGIVLSGAGPADSAYGAAWKDAHLPHADDEPSSLLDDRAVTACLAAAEGAETFRAVKIQAPADASVEERLALIGRLARLLR